MDLVGRVGFEPTTNGLKGRCSTTELPTLPMGRVKLNRASGWRKADFPADLASRQCEMGPVPVPGTVTRNLQYTIDETLRMPPMPVIRRFFEAKVLIRADPTPSI